MTPRRQVVVRHPSVIAPTRGKDPTLTDLLGAAGPGEPFEDVFFFEPDELIPWPDLNPRRHFDGPKFDELVASVKQLGILQPVLVHDTGSEPRWVVCGETRLRAAQKAGVRIPAIVRQLTEAQALEIALIENLHRSDLTAIEEARGFKRMLELPGITQAKLAEKIGRSQPYVANRIRLLELPEEALGLVEEGLIDPTAARDLLLPFAKIPQAKRAKLYAGVAKEIRDDRASSQLRRTVANVARGLSRSLQRSSYESKDAPLFDPKLHEQCTCNGPEFQYGWSGKERRCFDDAWWTAQQNRARAAQQASAEKAREKAIAKAKQIDGKPVLSGDSFRAKYPYNSYHTLANGRSVTRSGLVDPALLPAESLVLVKGRHGPPELVCVDMVAVKKAKAVVDKEKRQLLQSRKSERPERERAEVSRLGIEPWMLREMLRDRPMTDLLLDVAREHGIDLGKHGQVYDALTRLNDADVEMLFKVCALRARTKSSRYRLDPIEEEVALEIAQKYVPLIEALLPAPEPRAGLSAELNAQVDSQLRDLESLTSDEWREVPVDRIRTALAGWDELEPKVKKALTDDDVSIVQSAREQLADFEDEQEEGFGDFKCVECGCTDSHACEGGCSWLVRDAGRRVGVCSSCASSVHLANRILNDSIEVPAA